MKKTTKVIVGSTMTMAMCAALITGSTLALFSSESTTNIAITSGKVNVVATVDESTIEVSSTLAAGTPTEATYEDGTVTIAKMIPGDIVTFDIGVTNNSTIAVKWQLEVTHEDSPLFDVLEFTAEGDGVQDLVKMNSSWATPWHELAAPTEEGAEVATIHVTVTLPEEVSGAEYMDETCIFHLAVIAFQGNAHTADPVATAFNIQNEADVTALMTQLMDPETAAEVAEINLLGDLEMDNWTPLSDNFTGIFNGNGFTITYTGETDPEQLVAGMAVDGVMPMAEGAPTILNLSVRQVKPFGKQVNWDAEGVKTYVYQVNDYEGLKIFRDSVNNASAWWDGVSQHHAYYGETVELTADIDMKSEPWIRIGTNANYKKFAGTFNGNGYEFKNVVIGKVNGEETIADPAFFVGDVFNTLSNNNNGYVNNTITADAHLNYTVHNEGDFEMVYTWKDYTTTNTQQAVEKNWYINNVDGLKLFRDIVNYVEGHQYGTRSFTDDTVTLTADMDLADELWVRIGTGFTGKFVSNGYEFINVVTAYSATDLCKAQEWGQVFQNYVNGTADIDYTVHNDGDFEEVSHYVKAAGGKMISDHQWYIHNMAGYENFSAMASSTYGWNNNNRRDKPIATNFAPSINGTDVIESHTINLMTNLNFEKYHYFNYYVNSYGTAWSRANIFSGLFDGHNHLITYLDVEADTMDAGRLAPQADVMVSNATAASLYTAKIINLRMSIGGEVYEKLGEYASVYDAEGNYTAPHAWTIGDAARLKNFRDLVNGGRTFAGETVELVADIELPADENWVPIGIREGYKDFRGTFDGLGHTVSNVNWTGKWTYAQNEYLGFFGSATNVIKNLKVDGKFEVTGISGTGPVTINLAGFVGQGSHAHIATPNLILQQCINSIDLVVDFTDIDESVTAISGNIGGFISGIDQYASYEMHNCINEGNITFKGADDLWSNRESRIIQITASGFMSGLSVDKVSNLLNVGSIDRLSYRDTMTIDEFPKAVSSFVSGAISTMINATPTSGLYNLAADSAAYGVIIENDTTGGATAYYALGLDDETIMQMVPGVQIKHMAIDGTLDAEAAKQQSSYVGFNFDDVWVMDEATGLPTLQIFQK